MGVESQSYLDELSHRISSFKPTAILLEYNPVEDEQINKNFNNYLAGSYDLKTNEVDQLGFRIGKISNLKEVHSFDERSIRWRGEELFEQLHFEEDLLHEFEKKVKDRTDEENSCHAEMNLKELLLKYNSAEFDLKNKSFYISTNVSGAGESFVGAEASASWWHRNFRMFSKIQKLALSEQRIVVIGGQGHIALMRDFLKLDSQMVAEDVLSYL